ncbi:hypothetical protein COHA_001873 [Chlorella ohadii]|uniref:CCR4-NOT transcription complex subunit 3 n=1 Tax=Chlorella ohadii TaxID=2649997 RepID=A0AAD5DYE8_9CHLO|nr:hypothetical protein COHA_001873 [Chlorella ohadii]
MSSLRKLQQEIEKTLKKVQEGLEVFDDHQEQYDTTDPANTNAREKLESQLKDQIKKLQRLRDSIKTWMASSEIKDKTDITNARKEIERRMERFKLVEKEAKTKSFSKEGLNRSAMDPKERAKAEMRDWLTSMVDSLNTQIEEFEAEAEAAATLKKGKKPAPRVVHMEESIARHRQHIVRLEQILRLLDNDAMAAEDVEGVKDLVDDYLERNQEDFDEFDTPDDIYADLVDQLDGMTDAVVAAPPSHNKVAKDKEAKMEKEREERERERQKAAAAAVKAQLAAQGNTRLAVETAHAEEEKKTIAPARSTSSAKTPEFAAAAAAAAAPAAPPPPPPPDTPAVLTPAQSLQVLQQCAARSIPQPADTQWQSVPQRPRPPPVPIPASYPMQRTAIFDMPSLYEKLDAETLFFIFYNQPGSYQQYLAARELKRQAWRFHKQHSAWFQRHEEPKAGGQPGDDWEQGTYVYFDSTLADEAGSGWCYRLKQNFLFKYDALEDEVPVGAPPPAAPAAAAFPVAT